MGNIQFFNEVLYIPGGSGFLPSESLQIICCLFTLPKFNIEPENDGLEDDFPFPGVYSQVPC